MMHTDTSTLSQLHRRGSGADGRPIPWRWPITPPTPVEGQRRSDVVAALAIDRDKHTGDP